MKLIKAPNAKSLFRVMALSVAMSAGGTLAQEDAPPAPMRVDILMPQRFATPNHITAISAVDVDVRLSDTLATTRIAITVENQGRSTTQARIVLPVPEGSTIRTFGIDGIGDEPTARLLPREEATRRYNEIVRQMVDPGLLEFVGNAMIQSSVFPIEPGSKRTMTIVYEQTLDAHRGRVEYVLPRSAGYAGSSIDWSLDIELESVGAMGPVFSPSHPIVSKIINDRSMKVGVPMLDEPGAFRLYAVLGNEADATVLLYPDAENVGSGYFMFVADAPVVDPKRADRMLREMTIVIDRSGSMNGRKIAQARESAKQIVNGMVGEFIHIIDYADDIRSFSDGPVQVTKDTLPKIIAYIDNIESRGGTNLHDAITEALGAKVTPKTLPMVVFLTDGVPTVGVTDESTIRKAAKKANAHDRRVFTFGVGYDVNVPLLDGIAMDTRAEATFVLPNEDVEMKVGQVFDKLDGPVILDPVFGYSYAVLTSDQPDLRLIEPNSIGDLFSGSRVVVLGKYNNLTDQSGWMWVGNARPVQTMEGNEPKDGTSLVSAFHVEDASTRYGFVARLWAQKRMDSLINQIRLAGADGTEPDQELVDEIVRLSLEHGIMSEYTAFLAEEELGLELANRRDADGRTYALGESRKRMSQMNSRRSGAEAMSQTANRKNADAQAIQSEMDQKGEDYAYADGIIQSGTARKANKYLDSNMNQITINTIQRGPGATLYRKKGQWVDAKLGEQAGEEAEITVHFGDDEYWALVDDLVAQGRQWILANRGDVYFLNHSKRVLVHNPK